MSAAKYTGGCGGEEQAFLLPRDHQEPAAGDGDIFYHVPQHSRREKLRFPTEDDTTASAATTLSLPLYLEANNAAARSCCSYNNAHKVDDSGSLHQMILNPQGFTGLSLSPVIGPFTGYAAVLNSSGFVEPARHLLEEICQFRRGDFAACCQHRPPVAAFTQEGGDQLLDNFAPSSTTDLHGHHYWKKVKLVSMLDEVYKNYRVYHQHVEAVIASFETVAGLNTAVPYVSMALMSMFRNFRSLKNDISSNLVQLNKVSGKGPSGKRELSDFGLTGSSSTSDQACPQRRNLGSITHAWRPQRGLPEHAVGVLKAWLFQHFLHPYPTDNDKQLLAKQTALTRNQVSNWFINARVRLWKPMVEEIHNLELLQLQKSVATDDAVQSTDFQTLQPSSSAATSSSNRLPENIGAHMDFNQNRYYYKPSNIHELPRIEEPYYFVFNDYIGHGQPVSLTLGLYQNSRTVCMPEPLSMNVDRRFGLEECNNPYVLGPFEGQEIRQHGKEIGGRDLLRDFVD